MFDRLPRLFDPTPHTVEAWLVRMGRPEVSARDLKAFEAWLDADPARLADYQALKTTRREARTLKATLTGELAAIPARPRKATPRSRNLLIGGPILAALCVAVAGVALWPRLAPDPMTGATTYAAATGEIRDVVLADGSHVTLDTGSTIRVAMANDARRVVLDRGQAYFEVQHDTARPFRVGVGDRQVVVTGTRFVTTLSGDAASVALLQGSVSLTFGAGQTLKMKPGDGVSYRVNETGQSWRQVDPVETAPWRERRLVFRDAPVSEVVAQLSRYTPVRLVADPALAKVRVTAVFPLDGQDSVVERIDRLLPVAITASGPQTVTVRPE
jgi:transmembrane sensor